ncbi:MAG: AEC family transporter [Sakamotonia sp.]|jgi:predicted permease
MSTVLVKAACFIMIIGLGYILKRAGLMRLEELPVFSKLVIKITLPAAIIFNFSRITMDASMLMIVAVGLICSALYMAVGYGLFSGGSKEEKAFGLLNASGYNIGCFTMPFVQSFLGAPGVAAASLFDTGNAMICTGTSYAVAASVAGKGKRRGPAGMVRQLFSSVPFDCYVVMTVLTLLGIRLPGLAVQLAETVGNANTFLSLFMIGLGLELHMTKKQASAVARVVGVRFAVSLVLALVFYNLSPFDAEIRRTLAILMFAPVSSLGVPYTSMLQGDVNLAGSLNSASILTGIVSLTAAILIF